MAVTEIKYNEKNRTLNGTENDDILNASEYGYIVPTEGKNKDKGLTINGGKGSDTITGTAGNDKITGGSGDNIIDVYTKKEFGNDEVILTKGENLKIRIADIDETADVYKYCVREYINNDLKLSFYSDKYTYDDATCVITPHGELRGTITIKNYLKKDVLTSAGSFRLVNSGNTLLYDFRSSLITYLDSINPGELNHYDKDTYKGSWINDTVKANFFRRYDKDGNEITKETEGYEKVKGVTVSLGGALETGYNHFQGSRYADIVKGGNDKDQIYTGQGNDTYTLGKGEDEIVFLADRTFDTDTINLTKGEKLTLNFSRYGYTTVEEFKNNIKLTVSGKNLIIEAPNGKAILKNFAKSNVVGANGEVKFLIKAKTLTEEAIYAAMDEMQVTSDKGTWHNDYIDQSGYEIRKKGDVVTDVTKKGLTINGGDGADTIIGSNYSDTIKVGTGTGDSITGGTGNDNLYASTTAGSNTTFNFASGDGKDTVYSGKGEDTLNFENVSIKNISMSQGTGKNNKDLVIRYNTNESDSVTVKNYYTVDKKGKITGINKNNTIKQFTVMEGTYDLVNTIIGSGELIGNDNDNTVIGSAESDTITAGKGNDNIFAGGGNDTYIFNTGDGEDTINYVSGNDVIKFSDVEVKDMDFIRNGDDLEIHYGDSDIVTIKDYGTSIETIKIEDSAEKQYVLIHGWNSGSSIIGSEGNHILVGTSSDYGETIRVSKGENYFFGNGGSDELGGYSTSTNTYVIKNTSSFSTTIYSETKRDTVKFVDIKLEDLTFTMDGDYALIKYNGHTIVRISNFIKNGDINLLDYEGNNSTVSDELGIIYGDGENPIINGTDGADIIYGTSLGETITGAKGDDIIYGARESGTGGNNTYIFNKGDGNDTVYSKANSGEANDILKFADSTMEELDFIDNNSNHLMVKYGENDSVFVDLYFWPGSAGASTNKVTKFMVKDDENVYSIVDFGRHVVENDGETTEYVGKKMGDIFSSSTLNEIFEGKEGSNIYNFTTGSIGTDTVITTSGKDTINFTDVEVNDLTFTVVDNDLEISKNSEKVILQDYMSNLPAFSVKGANSTSKTSTQILADLGFTVGVGEITGTDGNNRIIGSAESDTITAGKGNDVITGGAGDDTYIFNNGDGEDILTYASGNDLIHFTNSVITDMDFVRRGDEVDIYYGTSDKLTLKNYKTSDSTIKIKDSTEREYTLKLGVGYNSNMYNSNSINVGAASRDVIRVQGNSEGQSVVFGNGGSDELGGYGDKVTYMIKKAHSYTSIFSMYPTVDSTIKFVDTTFDDISIRKSSESDYYIYFNENYSRIKLNQLGRYYNDYTLVDSTGTSKKLSTDFGFIFDSGEITGTTGADNIITTGTTAKIEGNGGDDIITNYNSGNTSIYTYKEGQKDTSSSTVSIYNGYVSGMNIYAQSGENYIYNINNYSSSNDNFFAYIDQKTYIEDNGGTTDTLTLTNTTSTTDGAKSNLHVLFNVSSTYTSEQGVSEIGNILVTNTATKANYDAWKANVETGSYTGISIRNNAIETINSSDSYILTSADIATLGQSVATWLSNNGYTSVDGVFSNALSKADNNSADITALIAQFDNTNWQSPTP